jgi:hypothetical protein
LTLVCSWHHKLVHEYGWSLTRRHDGSVRWYRPDGTRHRAGPALDPRIEPEPEVEAIQRDLLEAALARSSPPAGSEPRGPHSPEPMTGAAGARPLDAA